VMEKTLGILGVTRSKKKIAFRGACAREGGGTKKLSNGGVGRGSYYAELKRKEKKKKKSRD